MKRSWVQHQDDFISYYNFFVFICLMKTEKNNHPSLYQLHEERQNTGRCSNIKKKNHDEDKEVLSKDLLQLFK